MPSFGQIDYKTSGCVDGLVINGNADHGLRPRQLRRAAARALTRRFRAGFTGGLQYQYSRNKGTTQGSNEAATIAEHVRLRDRVRHQPAGHPAHLQRLARLPAFPARDFWKGGWRVGGIVNARSGVPINVTISRPDNATVNGADGDQHPRRQQPRHAAARPGARRRPVSEGRRALAQSGGVHHAAARHVRQPAAQLPARSRLLAARPDVQQGLPVPADARRSRFGSRCSTSTTG